MLDSVPVRHLRGLGGKLGESVVSWSGAETASDLKVKNDSMGKAQRKPNGATRQKPRAVRIGKSRRGVCMVIPYSIVWINRVRGLPVLLVVS